MTTIIESFVAELGWKEVGANVYEQHKRMSIDLAKGLAKLSAAYTAIAGVITGFVVKVNAETAANYRLAQSIGVSYEWLDRWSDAGEFAGVTAESIASAYGFLQKTLGELKLNPKNIREFNKELKTIGLSFSELGKLSPEKQIDTIANALSNVEDKALAYNLAQKLLGRQASKDFIKLGELAKANGQSLTEYLNRLDEYGLETERSAKGATDFIDRIALLKFTFDEAKSAIAGLVGEALIPLIEQSLKWIKANRELIQTKISEYAKKFADLIKTTVPYIIKLADAIGSVVTAIGGIGPVLKASGLIYLLSKFPKSGRLSLSINAPNAKQLAPIIGLLGGAGAAEIGRRTGEEWLVGFGVAVSSGAVLGGIPGMLAGGLAWAVDQAMTSLADPGANTLSNRIADWLFNSFDAGTNLAIERILESLGSGLKRIYEWINKNVPTPGEILNTIWKTTPYGRITDTFGALERDIKALTATGLEITGVNRPITQSQIAAPMPSLPRPGPNEYYNSVNNNVTINPAPGMSEEKIGREVSKQLQQSMNRAVKSMTTQSQSSSYYGG